MTPGRTTIRFRHTSRRSPYLRQRDSDLESGVTIGRRVPYVVSALTLRLGKLFEHGSRAPERPLAPDLTRR
jgi:hypothetical protein